MNADTPSNIVLIHGKATGLSPKQFHYAFGDTMSRGVGQGPGAPGWEEVAGYALDWALQKARSS